MKCSGKVQWIVDDLYGDLPPQDEKHHHDHLASCLRCRKRQAAYRRIIESHDRIRQVDPPAELSRIILDAARPHRSVKRAGSFFGRHRFAVSAAAAAMIFCVVGVSYFLRYGDLFQMPARGTAPVAGAGAPAGKGSEPVESKEADFDREVSPGAAEGFALEERMQSSPREARISRAVPSAAPEPEDEGAAHRKAMEEAKKSAGRGARKDQTAQREAALRDVSEESPAASPRRREPRAPSLERSRAGQPAIRPKLDALAYPQGSAEQGGALDGASLRMAAEGPYPASVLLEEARSLFQGGRFTRAAATFEQYLELYPEDEQRIQAFIELALTYHELKRKQRALEVVNEALARFPDHREELEEVLRKIEAPPAQP